MKTEVVASTLQLFQFLNVFKPYQLCVSQHDVAGAQAADVDGLLVWEVAATI